MKIEDVDFVVLHQANKFILDFLRKKINVPKEKFFFNMKNTGNTVSATIPIALKQLVAENKLKKGDKILLTGFGVGLSWGSTIITY
jgi:3-oxoacyl-[acyl-carrier-protein] synthase III